MLIALVLGCGAPTDSARPEDRNRAAFATTAGSTTLWGTATCDDLVPPDASTPSEPPFPFVGTWRFADLCVGSEVGEVSMPCGEGSGRWYNLYEGTLTLSDDGTWTRDLASGTQRGELDWPAACAPSGCADMAVLYGYDDPDDCSDDGSGGCFCVTDTPVPTDDDAGDWWLDTWEISAPNSAGTGYDTVGTVTELDIGHVDSPNSSESFDQWQCVAQDGVLLARDSFGDVTTLTAEP